MKTNEPKLLKLEVGKYYRTYGGWKALVIWEINDKSDMGLKICWEGQPKYYVIHKPQEESECAAITHSINGKAITSFSVGEPPLYTEHHPADLKELWK